MKNGKFELHVCVGGKPLQEIKSETGETWVEASFKTDATYYSKPATEVDPHGETYEATWPVTPYTLQVTNNSSEKVYCKVFVDGKEASWEYIDPAKTVVVKGFRDMNSRYQSYSEFLFQLPRRLLSNEKEKLVLSDQERDDLKKHLETIKCEFFGCQAEYTKEEYDDPSALRSAGFDSINKAVAEATSATSTSGMGKVDAANVTRGTKTYTYYKLLGMISSLTIRYAQRRKLEMLGLMAPVAGSGTVWAQSRNAKRAAEDAAAAAEKAAEAAASGAASGAAAAPPKVKTEVKQEPKRQKPSSDEVVDLCD